MAPTKPINPPCLNVSKRKTRAALSTFSHFYDSRSLTNTDKFSDAIARFVKIIADSHTIDSSLQQSIASAVTSAIATAVTFIQPKHERKLLFLQEMIKKSLLLRDSSFANPFSNPDAAPKAYPSADPLPKSITKR